MSRSRASGSDMIVIAIADRQAKPEKRVLSNPASIASLLELRERAEERLRRETPEDEAS